MPGRSPLTGNCNSAPSRFTVRRCTLRLCFAAAEGWFGFGVVRATLIFTNP
jgi:hypothetical protein